MNDWVWCSDDGENWWRFRIDRARPDGYRYVQYVPPVPTAHVYNDVNYPKHIIYDDRSRK